MYIDRFLYCKETFGFIEYNTYLICPFMALQLMVAAVKVVFRG